MRSNLRTHRLAASAAVIALIGIGGFAAAQVQRTPAPKGAELYFIAPKDGETVTSPVTVKFGLKGMGVAPAGIALAIAGAALNAAGFGSNGPSTTTLSKHRCEAQPAT